MDKEGQKAPWCYTTDKKRRWEACRPMKKPKKIKRTRK